LYYHFYFRVLFAVGVAGMLLLPIVVYSAVFTDD